MSKAAPPEDPDNVIQLPVLPVSTDRNGARETALRIRTSLSVLRGYADFLEGASPAVQAEVLKVMAGKTQAMIDILRPFAERNGAKRRIDDYRRVRDRTRQLILSHRQLLSRLETNLRADDPGQDASNAELRSESR